MASDGESLIYDDGENGSRGSENGCDDDRGREIWIATETLISICGDCYTDDNDHCNENVYFGIHEQNVLIRRKQSILGHGWNESHGRSLDNLVPSVLPCRK